MERNIHVDARSQRAERRMKRCDKSSSQLYSSRFACSLFRYSWIPGHGFSSDPPYGSSRDSDSSRGSRQFIRPEPTQSILGDDAGIPALFSHLPGSLRATCRSWGFRAKGSDFGMMRGRIPARLRDSTPRKRHVRSWARRPDSGTLAPSRPVPRHVDARSTSTARHGRGTLRESRGYAGRFRQ